MELLKIENATEETNHLGGGAKGYKIGGIWYYESEIPLVNEMLENPANHQAVKEWLQNHIMPYMTLRTNNPHSMHSNHIKSKAESHLQFYVSNGQIKYILAELGYHGEQQDWHSPNYCYPLSLKVRDHIARLGRYRSNSDRGWDSRSFLKFGEMEAGKK